MSALVIILPVVTRQSFDRDDWIEQHLRERAGLVDPKYRTRPLLVVDNVRKGEGVHS